MRYPRVLVPLTLSASTSTSTKTLEPYGLVLGETRTAQLQNERLRRMETKIDSYRLCHSRMSRYPLCNLIGNLIDLQSFGVECPIGSFAIKRFSESQYLFYLSQFPEAG